jgi:hypothetical protein
MSTAYEAFLAQKGARTNPSGFETNRYNPGLFPFQQHIVQKALSAGRHAVFADCGLGKTFMELEFADQVSAYTGQAALFAYPDFFTTSPEY